MELLMHVFNMAAVFVVLSLVGVELSVFAFVNPAAWRLDAEPQLKMVSRLAFVLGKVMPVWYPLCAVLLGVETWLYWRTSGRGVLLTADALWLLASVASIFFIVPLNTCVAAGDPDWQRIHRTWDKRHRMRTAALAVAAVLLSCVVVR